MPLLRQHAGLILSLTTALHHIRTTWLRVPSAGRGSRAYPALVDIEAKIAALGGRYTVEAAVIERVLREHGGAMPDKQLIEEAGLALAIHRQQLRS